MDAQDVNGNDWLDYRPERIGGATDKGPRRSENQDAFWIPGAATPTDLGALYLVADGVGGQQDGAVAAKLAVEIVQQVFYELRGEGEAVSIALKNGLEKANEVILKEAQKRQVRKMGSTFVAVVLDGDKLTAAHVGDARAYLVRQGKMQALTRDDTWVQRQVDAGLISAEEAAKHEFRNVVTQVLGNRPDITVNLSKSHTLQPGDAIMLCSDGLYDVLSDGQMTSLILENEPQRAAESLVQAAVKAEATDNITAVVVRTGAAAAAADEPTLVSTPVAAAESPTLVSPPPDKVLPTIPPIEEAQTVAIKAPPPAPPAAKEKEKEGISKWLIILAIVAVLLIVGALALFWLNSSNVASSVEEAVETAQPGALATASAEIPGALNTLIPTSTVALPTATQVPVETPTVLAATPTPMPTLIPSPTPDTAVAPGELTSGFYATVDNTDGLGVTVRDGPSTQNAALLVAEEGTTLLILDGPEEGGGLNWWQVRLDDGTEGWVAEDFLEPSAEDASNN
jgi:protein phosphatase